MEATFLYLAKSSALLAAFLLAYHFLLRKETFFSANRWYLLAGLVASTVLPAITFRKIIWVDPVVRNVEWTALSGVETQHLPAAIEQPEINWFIVAAAVYLVGMLCFLLRFIADFLALRSVLKGQVVQQNDGYKIIDTPA
ncbi:MAG TPA: peptidase M56, partial [Flavobacterium sp.]|nr:peptidase M56 [Flavobacterium sp.]